MVLNGREVTGTDSPAMILAMLEAERLERAGFRKRQESEETAQ